MLRDSASLAALWVGRSRSFAFAVPTLGPIWLASLASRWHSPLLRSRSSVRDVPSFAAHWRAYLAIGTVIRATVRAVQLYRRAIHLRVERRDSERDQPVFWRDRRRRMAA
jgi:hypothetical protein